MLGQAMFTRAVSDELPTEAHYQPVEDPGGQHGEYSRKSGTWS